MCLCDLPAAPLGWSLRLPSRIDLRRLMSRFVRTGPVWIVSCTPGPAIAVRSAAEARHRRPDSQLITRLVKEFTSHIVESLSQPLGLVEAGDWDDYPSLSVAEKYRFALVSKSVEVTPKKLFCATKTRSSL